MARNVDLEFKELLGGADDDNSPLVNQDADILGKTIADIEHNFDSFRLAQETAVPNTRLREHYQKIAATAAAAVAPPKVDNLAKRARDPRCKKIEETVYPSGRKVIAEMDERGVVIRTYAVDGDDE